MAQPETFGLPGSLAGLDGWGRSFGPSGALARLLLQVLLRRLGLLLLMLLRLWLRLRWGNRFRYGWLFPWPALATRSGVDEVLRGSVVRRGRWRLGNYAAEYAVEVV